MKASKDLKWAVASVSLGKHPSHTLERKIQAAAANSFQGVELVYNELLQHAASHLQSTIESARQICSVATEHSMTILSISALKNFDGNLEVPPSRTPDAGARMDSRSPRSGYENHPSPFNISPWLYRRRESHHQRASSPGRRLRTPQHRYRIRSCGIRATQFTLTGQSTHCEARK
ncbi:hypothetical protein DPSP01_002157 [Paraphaeosphaeria sporulosa]